MAPGGLSLSVGAPSGTRRSDAEAQGAQAPSAAAPPQVPRGIYLYTFLGVLLFTLFSVASYAFGLGDPELMALHKAKVAPEAYLVPACCFTTAFCLNALTMLFERDGQKFQLAYLGAYIQLLAASNDYLSYAGMAPIMRGWYPPSSSGVHVLRLVMWTLTTPFMVYLLSKLSDFGRDKVVLAVATDVVMLVAGTLGDVLTYAPLALLFNAISWVAFPFLVYMMWCMFDGAIAHSTSHANKLNLEVLRLFTLGFWFLFPVLHCIKRCGFLDLFVEEWLWTLCDFVGKVMFSSSLMFENFLTIEQRRIIAMHIVEASNRTQVIEELKSLVEHKERFMSSMSHELRTPLNGIIGLSDALLIGSCGDVSESVRRTLNTIKTSGARLLNLINDILDASAMRHGKLTIKQERVALHQVVDDVLDLCRPLAKPKVKLVNNLPRNLPPVLGDTGRIIQILHNIVGNSCKFTHTGTIAVSATVSGEAVRLSISDTGIGIPAEKFDQIFEAFQQVDMSTTRKYGGTGLGLNIVKTLVEAHDSMVEISSKLGQGTSFSFALKVWDSARDAFMDVIGPAAGAIADVPQPDEEDLAFGIPAAGAAGPLRKMLHASRVRASQSRSSLGTPSTHGSRAAPGAAAGATAPPASPSKGGGGAVTQQDGLGAGACLAAVTALSAVAAASPSGIAAVAGPAGVGVGAAAGASKGAARRQEGPEGEGAPGALDLPERSFDSAFVAGELEGRGRHMSADAAAGAGVAGAVPDAEPCTPGAESAAAGASAVQGARARRARLATDSKAGLAAGTGSVGRGKSRGSDAAGEGRAERGPPQRRASSLRRRVLSVDDDPVNQLVMQALLTPEGYEVIQAMNGFEALQYMEEAESMPDIILLDVMMPGMSGYEVCRKLRELYPNSCIPIIMVSAKRAEEHIVEGLSSGSNDYIVKPFGRKEILARVAAHLEFRDSVYKAGEEAAEEDLLAGWMDVPDQLLSCLRMGNKYFSLPNSVKSQLENMSNHPSIMVFNQLTMVVAEVCDLQELARAVAPDILLGALASLYIYVDELLGQHPCYLVDCLEGRIVVVTGLAGDSGAEQAEAALGFAKGLQEAAGRIKLSETSNMQLSIGVHSCAAQGVIVGVNHPVLHFTGNLPERASRLQCTCPPGCIQLSAQAYEQLGPSHSSECALAIDSGAVDSTYLHKSGLWSDSIRQVPGNLARYLSHHPFGPLNTGAYRLRPIQLALMSMVRADAGLLLGLVNSLNSMGAKANPTDASAPATRRSIGAGSATQAPGSHLPPVAGEATHALVAQLQQEKELLTRQLESVEQECERLQVTVDSLELELQSHMTLPRSASQQSFAQTASSPGVYPSPGQHQGQQGQQGQQGGGFLLVPSQGQHSRQQGQQGGGFLLTSSGGSPVGGGRGVSIEEHEEVLAAFQDAANALDRIEQELVECRQERDSAVAMLEAAEERVQQLGLQVEELQSQVVHAQVHLQARLAPPRRNVTRGPSILGSGYAYGAAMRRRSTGLHVVPRQDLAPTGDYTYTSSSSSQWAHSFNLPGGRSSMESSGPNSGASIRSFLEDAGLGHIAAKFEAEEITPPMLPMLDDTQLKDLGVYTMGQRVRLKLAVDCLLQVEVGEGEEGVGAGVGCVGLLPEGSEGVALDTLTE